MNCCKRRPLAFIVCGAWLALLACGAPPRIDTFTADPATITKSGQDVTLRWTVTGTTSVAIEPCCAGLSTSGERTVQVSAPATFTLTAVNDHGSATQSVAVGATLPSISGQVEDLFGNRVPQASLTLNGKAVPIQADGTFTANVVQPYDATVASDTDVTTILGLTTTTPVLTLAQSRPAQVSALAGSVTGIPADGTFDVIFQGSSSVSYGTVDSTGAFTINAKAYGPMLEGRLVVIATTPPFSQAPLAFRAFGASGRISVDAGQPATLDLSVAPTTTQAWSVDAGGVPFRSGYATLSAQGLQPVGLTLFAGTTTSVALPVLPGESVQTTITVADGDGDTRLWTTAAPGAPLEFSPPRAPTLTAPDAGAQLSRSGVLTWSAADEVCEIALARNAQPLHRVFARGGALRLDQLPPALMPLDEWITWSARCFSGPQSIDDVAVRGGVDLAYKSPIVGKTGNRTFFIR